MKKIITSEQNMINFGYDIAKNFTDGSIILLNGELGTGKTTITKGIAKYLGIDDNIVSPTFSIMNIYEIKKQKSNIKHLIHIDTYRLEHENDLIEIGVEDYLGCKNTITIIEWPEKITSLLDNKKVITISIEHVEDGRKVEVKK